MCVCVGGGVECQFLSPGSGRVQNQFRTGGLNAADLREVVDLQLLLVSCDGLDLFRRLSLLLQLLHGGVVQLGIDLFCQLLRDGLG